MKALLIGGTGLLSTACAARALQQGWELTMVNRGIRSRSVPEGVRVITADVRSEQTDADALFGTEHYDTVVDFIAFTVQDIERDIRWFTHRTDQFIFISSASAYQKPVAALPITESTPLANPYWEYSRMKADCEERLMQEYRRTGFPVTIVRPSQTCSGGKLPLGIMGDAGAWQTLLRMKQGRPVIIPGDGTTHWASTHADDFAVGFTGLMGNPRALGTAVHITTEETLTWDQIYTVIADALRVPLNAVHISCDFLAGCGRRAGYDFEGPLQGDKLANVQFDNAKIRSLVPEFAPRMSMAQLIRNAVQYIETHPELQTPDPKFDEFCDRVLAARAAALDAF